MENSVASHSTTQLNDLTSLNSVNSQNFTLSLTPTRTSISQQTSDNQSLLQNDSLSTRKRRLDENSLTLAKRNLNFGSITSPPEKRRAPAEPNINSQTPMDTTQSNPHLDNNMNNSNTFLNSRNANFQNFENSNINLWPNDDEMCQSPATQLQLRANVNDIALNTQSNSDSQAANCSSQMSEQSAPSQSSYSGINITPVVSATDDNSEEQTEAVVNTPAPVEVAKNPGYIPKCWEISPTGGTSTAINAPRFMLPKWNGKLTTLSLIHI